MGKKKNSIKERENLKEHEFIRLKEMIDIAFKIWISKLAGNQKGRRGFHKREMRKEKL